MEHLLEIQSRIHSNFDLFTTLSDITEEAKKVTGAKKSVVFLLKGNPPALHGHFKIRGKENQVVIKIDGKSAVGYAAAHKLVVNLRDIQSRPEKKRLPDFDNSFDEQCGCSTDSLLAVPAIDSDKRVTGVITVANAAKGFFSADDEWFMRTFAMEVALALEKQKFLQQSVSALRLASIGETVAGLSHCIKNIAHALRGSSYIIKRARAGEWMKKPGRDRLKTRPCDCNACTILDHFRLIRAAFEKYPHSCQEPLWNYKGSV